MKRSASPSALVVGCLVFVVLASVGHAVEGGSPSPAPDDPAARDLLKRVLEAAPQIPFVAHLTLTIEGGPVRELALSHKRMGDARASYLEVTAPLNVKDTRFLFLERTTGRDEQFIYVPAMKRVSQIGEEARKQPFLGSEFYVSDLVTPALDDFTYAFVGEAEVQGRACRLVETRPKATIGELYSKTILAIDPKDLLVLRAEFFDPKGKPLKTWTVERLEKIDGIWTAMAQRMTNVQENASSRLAIGDIRYNADVPDETFNRAYLGR